MQARKLVVVFGGFGMTLLIPTIAVSKLAVIITLFAVAIFSYAAWSTIALTLAADLYRTNGVATVSGLSARGRWNWDRYPKFGG